MRNKKVIAITGFLFLIAITAILAVFLQKPTTTRQQASENGSIQFVDNNNNPISQTTNSTVKLKLNKPDILQLEQ